jgi:carbonic anhydrase/acetyltransferase-like protein (isoleucine patch superfamily)
MLIEFEGKRPKLGHNVFIAPTAVIIGDVTIGDNTSIWFNTVVRGDFGAIRIGAGCSIQDNATVHVFNDETTIIHDNVTIGHNCALEGCVIGQGSVMGMNSTILPMVTIGEQVMVAAGSVIPERSTIPDRVLVAGVPARVKKELSGTSLEWIANAPRDYQGMQARYRAQGIDRLRILSPEQGE